MPTASVMTVTGPVPTTSLGVTLSHEHLIADLSRSGYQDAGAGTPIIPSRVVDDVAMAHAHALDLDDNLRLDDLDVAIAELRPFRASGGNTVVELTPTDAGRAPGQLREIAVRTGLLIVMGSGRYRAAGRTTPRRTQIADLVEEIQQDLEAGVDGVRAGVIGEIGTSDPLHPNERNALIAAARVQGETGRALFVHVDPWANQALELLDLCEQSGADPARVVLCHLDAQLPRDPLFRAIAARGAWVSFDLFGDDRDVYAGRRFPTDHERVRSVVTAFDEGWADHLLVSHDVALKTRLARFGGSGYGHLLESVVPLFRSAGLTGASVQQLLVANPARLLGFPSITDVAHGLSQ